MLFYVDKIIVVAFPRLVCSKSSRVRQNRFLRLFKEQPLSNFPTRPAKVSQSESAEISRIFKETYRSRSLIYTAILSKAVYSRTLFRLLARLPFRLHFSRVYVITTVEYSPKYLPYRCIPFRYFYSSRVYSSLAFSLGYPNYKKN